MPDLEDKVRAAIDALAVCAGLEPADVLYEGPAEFRRNGRSIVWLFTRIKRNKRGYRKRDVLGTVTYRDTIVISEEVYEVYRDNIQRIIEEARV